MRAGDWDGDVRLKALLRTAPAALAALLLMAGCRGEGSGAPQVPPSLGTAQSAPLPSRAAVGEGGVQPGIHPAAIYGELRNPYAGNVSAMATGRLLFLRYNCYGCHGGRAGGGMGPSLRDDVWRYGSSDTQIFATISEGRPAGMPAWGGRIPEDQIWQLISYIRSLRTPQEPDRITVQAGK
ncbi:MAG TPA: c-type cytochrome [Gemmatimonadaceae bacterium]|nr:c-type cytochrome [Gemmatimonadaceae bacterium]